MWREGERKRGRERERECTSVQLSEGRTPRADTSPHPRRVRETVHVAEEAQLAKEGERGGRGPKTAKSEQLEVRRQAGRW